MGVGSCDQVPRLARTPSTCGHHVVPTMDDQDRAEVGIWLIRSNWMFHQNEIPNFTLEQINRHSHPSFALTYFFVFRFCGQKLWTIVSAISRYDSFRNILLLFLNFWSLIYITYCVMANTVFFLLTFVFTFNKSGTCQHGSNLDRCSRRRVQWLTTGAPQCLQ